MRMRENLRLAAEKRRNSKVEGREQTLQGILDKTEHKLLTQADRKVVFCFLKVASNPLLVFGILYKKMW